MNIRSKLAESRIIPVLTPISVDSSLRTAQTLHSAGVGCIEIALRTESALESICAVKELLPDLTLAAGTVLDTATVNSAAEAGADLCFSPGISIALLEACEERALPIVPGISSASEVLLGMQYGISIFKLFPAHVLGGVNLLNAFSGPFPGVSFCPTGGLTPSNLKEYLSLHNVICCGGSWMAPQNLVKEKRWDDIRWLAEQAREEAGLTG